MKPFFSEPARTGRLLAGAISLEGTPWGANSCVPGVAMSCHLAVVWLLRQAGFPIDLKSIPRATSSWARHQTDSLVEKWLDARPEFARLIVPSGSLIEQLLPGDVLGFKCGLCIHHVGLALPHPVIFPDGRTIDGPAFFQCLNGGGAVTLSQTEAAFKKHIACAWRPLEPASGGLIASGPNLVGSAGHEPYPPRPPA